MIVEVSASISVSVHTAGESMGALKERGPVLTYALQVVAQEILWLAGGVKVKDSSAEAEEEAVVHALHMLDLGIQIMIKNWPLSSIESARNGPLTSSGVSIYNNANY